MFPSYLWFVPSLPSFFPLFCLLYNRTLCYYLWDTKVADEGYKLKEILKYTTKAKTASLGKNAIKIKDEQIEKPQHRAAHQWKSRRSWRAWGSLSFPARGCCQEGSTGSKKECAVWWIWSYEVEAKWVEGVRGMKVMFQSDSLEPVALWIQKLIKENHVSNLQARQASSHDQGQAAFWSATCCTGAETVSRGVYLMRRPH